VLSGGVSTLVFFVFLGGGGNRCVFVLSVRSFWVLRMGVWVCGCRGWGFRLCGGVGFEGELIGGCRLFERRF